MLDGLQRFADHPLVGEVKGVGMIAGIELVKDKRTRAIHEPAGKAGKVVDRIGRENGLVLRVIGDRIAFAPPFVISEAEIDDMVARVGRTLDASQRELAG
jgi:4-aminobutyrate--pyruvate transaminase